MAISLYEVTVPGYLQTVSAISGVLGRGLKFCEEKGLDPQKLAETRLYPDMLPLTFQVKSVAHHSIDAIGALKSGVFDAAGGAKPETYADLVKLVDDTQAALKALKPADVNALEGRDVLFQFGDMKMPFVAEHFILSFSIPNFHFHATTAYDILRSQGVSLGKRHYLGELRVKA